VRHLAVLLTEEGVARTLARESVAERALDGAVGFADGRQVGLRLDDEITRAKARRRERVGVVGELQREREVLVDGGRS